MVNDNHAIEFDRLKTLTALSATELRELIAAAQKRLKQVEEEQRKAAINQIKELAASTGLRIRVGPNGKGAAAGRNNENADHRKKFVHPDDPKVVYYLNRGRKPQWVRDLEARGMRPS